MAGRCTKAEWTEIKRDLLAVTAMPANYSITIYRRRLAPGLYGTAQLVNEGRARFRVEVSDELSAAHSAEVLIHELAHVLDWRPTTPWTTDHGPTFWIHVGEIWRRYHRVS